MEKYNINNVCDRAGELSRLSLAIQVITSACSTAETMIFDEVDVGIGGKTAEIVGQLLKKLGDVRQIICITHLPQVAAHGDQHLTDTCFFISFIGKPPFIVLSA